MLEMNYVLGIISPRCCSNGHTGQDKTDRVGKKERREIGWLWRRRILPEEGGDREQEQRLHV